MLLLPIDVHDCTGQALLGSTVSTDRACRLRRLLRQTPPPALGAVADADSRAEPEQESCDDRQASTEGRQGGVLRQLMLKLLLTENGLPEKAGTRTERKRAATQAPVGVPSNGGPETVADWVPPLGAKRTTTRPVPVGPLAFLQPAAAAAAAPSRALASPMLNGPASTAGAAAALGAGALAGSFEAGVLVAVFVS